MEIDMLPIRFGMERPLDPNNSEKKIINFSFVILKIMESKFKVIDAKGENNQ